MIQLPQNFIDRMQKQLPKNEWEAFFAVYANEKPFKGVRINRLKGETERICAMLPFIGEKIEWVQAGYYTSDEKLGASPFHHAGLFYSQEPSAMCAVPRLQVQAGEKVLDLCSAPGGKATQIAEYMQGQGILVCNEPISSRAKILSQNIERMGVKNAVVTNEMPSALAKKLPEYFDKILVDAPCSGEGMFRKNTQEAVAEWSDENVTLCSIRQAEILHEASKMLKVGGRLVYSTCTFSVQEDEEQAQNFVTSHPEFVLLEQDKLYPHKVAGEGHFVAVFEKIAQGEKSEIPVRIREHKRFVSRETEKIYREFERKFFNVPFATNLHEVKGVLYDLPKGVFELQGLSLLRAGVRLGEMKNGRFEPNHALCMAVRADECANILNYAIHDTRVEKFLRGETIDDESAKQGWCLVCVQGYPLGLGKAVGGVVKNHLPKGIRK